MMRISGILMGLMGLSLAACTPMPKVSSVNEKPAGEEIPGAANVTLEQFEQQNREAVKYCKAVPDGNGCDFLLSKDNDPKKQWQDYRAQAKK